MFMHWSTDPRDRLAYATGALQGVCELLEEIGCAAKAGDGRVAFEQATPRALHLLLEGIRAELVDCEIGFRSFVPRGWTPPAA